MRRQILLILFGIITFCVGVCFVYFTYFRQSEQKLNSIALTQNSNDPNWELLLSFENKDLTKIDKEDEKKLEIALNQIGAEINNRAQLGTFSKISNAQNKTYYALIGMIHLLGVPGSCSLQIQLFDLQGKLIKSISFQSGYRIDLSSVKVEFIPELDRNVIVVESYRFENGRDIAKQYYGLVNEDILLIRLENSEGKLIPNRYYASNHTIGITPPQRSEEQWINSLKSTDIVELLASLEFLGGDHQGDIVWVGGNHPKIKTEETKFIDKLHAYETVKSKIFEFANSDNKWLRDSANLVLNGED
ncbi:MAG: hypothetical protein K1X72_25050 [Pyrinomonadaceae bacterium]|nr:hypothetical protein [Pyrinomonadaceae bacterium]